MRQYEVMKCKRQALGMTQKDLGEICGVSAMLISRYELGDEISSQSFAKIKRGMDDWLSHMTQEERLEFELVYRAYTLNYLKTDEKQMQLAYMQTNMASLMLKLMTNK